MRTQRPLVSKALLIAFGPVLMVAGIHVLTHSAWDSSEFVALGIVFVMTSGSALLYWHFTGREEHPDQTVTGKSSPED